MSGPGRYTAKHGLTVAPRFPLEERTTRAKRRRSPARLGVTAAVAAVLAVGAMIAAVVMTHEGARPARGGPAQTTAAQPSARAATGTVTANAAPYVTGPGRQSVRGTGFPASPSGSVPGLAVSLVLTAADHRDCPAAATACVDLARHITWLQAQGKITFGPVQMEPGRPTGQHQTPRGTFQVSWKAGPNLVSNIYHEPMPWATFFAPGGIAFHGGSLTAWSHGCVHLTVANAHYYNEHLPIGAQVVVF
jgi:hypothetical protein